MTWTKYVWKDVQFFKIYVDLAKNKIYWKQNILKGNTNYLKFRLVVVSTLSLNADSTKM